MTAVKFIRTKLEGAWIVEPDRHEDDRGFFARTWCHRELSEQGLTSTLSQSSISFNRLKGTVRGMHFQHAPHAEAKLVRCTAGSILDVIVDLRPGSPTFMSHFAVRLDARLGNAIYVPEGMAHGFQTTEDESEVLYYISVDFHPESAGGIRWNDPAVRIEWPLPISAISERDATYPDYSNFGQSP